MAKVAYIIGNPPFLGGKRLRAELGDTYTDALFEVLRGKSASEADLVTYWFEKAKGARRGRKTGRVRFSRPRELGGVRIVEFSIASRTLVTYFGHNQASWILDSASVRFNGWI